MAKVSVVTGGAGGIGIEVARLLAKETDVLVADIQEARIEVAKEELKDFSNIEYLQMDVTKLEDVQAMADKALSMGELQNVVHCAAINEVFVDRRVSVREIVTANTTGALNMGKVFFPILPEGSSYINIASMTSYYRPTDQYVEDFEEILKGNFEPIIEKIGETDASTAYGLSKAFVRWYSMSNIDLIAERGARINTISPGVIWTPMPQAVEAMMPGVIVGFASMCPVEGRMGEPEEVAELAYFLCHAKYINGEDILIDGGMLHHIQVPQFY